MIRMTGITKSYRAGPRAVPVLRQINLHIASGELVAIMGSSGSGKSTLLNILGILDDYDEGLYELDGTPMRGLSERQAAVYRNQFLGFVFQSFNLLALKTAVENVELPLQYRGIARRLRKEMAMEALGRVGLTARADHLPSELSGGEKQRVAIARAVVTKPRVVLADEPTGALDTKTSDQIMDLLQETNAAGVTMVIVTHEPDVAARCPRLVRIRDGQIQEQGEGETSAAAASPSRPAGTT